MHPVHYPRAELTPEAARLMQDCHYLAPQFATAFSAPSNALTQEHREQKTPRHYPGYHKFTKHSLHSIDTFSRVEGCNTDDSY